MSAKEKSLPWVILLTVLLVYLAFPTKNYYWDGITFARTIESSRSLNPALFHPNHLIYNVVGYLTYSCARNVGLHARAISVLQVMNSTLSALSALMLFQILRVSLRSVYPAAALTLLFSFSATWWKFSTDANSYIPSVLFLLVSFYLVLPGRKPRPLLVALTHSVSMAFHQLAVLFFPVAALGIFLQASSLTSRGRAWRVAQYGAVAFLITFGTFYLCFYLQAGVLSFGDLARWLTSYSPEVGFVFNAKDSLTFTLRGHARLLFGGRFNFLREVINPFTILLTGVLISACAALVALLVLRPRGVKVEKDAGRISNYKQLVSLCVAWIVPYLVFLFFWIPQNTFYRLFYLPSLIVLGGVLAGRSLISDRRRRFLALSVIIVALSNFLFLIYPYAQVRKNTPLFLALKMNGVWSPKTVVYFSHQNSNNELVGYFNPATTWKKLGPTGTEEIGDELREIYLNGGTAWLETSAFKQISRQEGGQQWLSVHSREQPEYVLTDPAYDLRLVQIFPGPETTDSKQPR